MDELMTQETFDKLIEDIAAQYARAIPKRAKAAYAAALARIAELEQAQRCIPVAERLPAQGTKVLIFFDTPCVEDEPDVAVYIGDDLWSIGPEEYLDRMYTKVTHWMPLPPALEVKEEK